MEKNNLIMGIMGFMVCIILLGGLLMPIVTDAIDGQHVYYNNTEGQLSSIAGNDTVTLSLTYDDSFNEIYKVNNVTVPLKDNYTDLIVSSDVAMVSITTDRGAISNRIAYFNGSSMSIENATSITVTLTADNVDIAWVKNDTPSTVSLDINWGFYATETGDYCTAYLPWDIYLNDINQIYGASWLVTYSKFFSFHGDKVVCDGVEYTPNITMTPVNGVVNVSTISQRSYSAGYGFTVNYTGTDYGVVPYSVIVPVEIEGDVLGHSDTISGMLAVLPIIVIACLVAVAASVFIGRKF